MTRKIFKPQIVIPSLIAFVFIYVFIQLKATDRDLRKNGVLINATIIEFLGSSQGGSGANPGYLCRFYFNGEQKELISWSSIKVEAKSYVGKTYPALYSVRYNVLRLLMNPQDYRKYQIDYPDSLE